MTNRVCSYCGSDTYYDNDKQSNGHWYSLTTRDRICLYFLCNNCYSKQTNKNTQGLHAKWQNRKEVGITKNF